MLASSLSKLDALLVVGAALVLLVWVLRRARIRASRRRQREAARAALTAAGRAFEDAGRGLSDAESLLPEAAEAAEVALRQEARGSGVRLSEAGRPSSGG